MEHEPGFVGAGAGADTGACEGGGITGNFPGNFGGIGRGATDGRDCSGADMVSLWSVCGLAGRLS